MAHRIPGHGQPILACQFSPVSSGRLATGSGDNTARIWDTETGTPKYTLKGHTGWVLGVSWSPDGERLATCSMDKSVRIWDPETGKPFGQELKGHAKWVLNMAWEPYHGESDATCPVKWPANSPSSMARRHAATGKREQGRNLPHLGGEHRPDRARPQWPQGLRELRQMGRNWPHLHWVTRQDCPCLGCSQGHTGALHDLGTQLNSALLTQGPS